MSMGWRLVVQHPAIGQGWHGRRIVSEERGCDDQPKYLVVRLYIHSAFSNNQVCAAHEQPQSPVPWSRLRGRQPRRESAGIGIAEYRASRQAIAVGDSRYRDCSNLLIEFSHEASCCRSASLGIPPTSSSSLNDGLWMKLNRPIVHQILPESFRVPWTRGWPLRNPALAR